MMQDGNDLHELFFLEQAIPEVAPEPFRADVAQPETAGWWLVRVLSDPVQACLDRVEAAFCLERNVLVVVGLDVSEISLSVGEDPDGGAHVVW